MISIKTDEEIKIMKHAGHINYLTHKLVEKNIKPGISTKELDKIAYNFIIENDGIPSFLNYSGFPASICTSINDEVVHGIPSDRILEDGDIISVDIGVLWNGYHSDSAATYPVGNISDADKHLLEHTKQSLYEGIKEVKAGAKLGNISSAIEKYAHKNKLSVVEELVGHGVGKKLHEDPDVPNYGKYNTGMTLKKGMVIAIEPMLNYGSKNICILDDDWTICTIDGKKSAHFEHTVAITEDGYIILTGED